LRSNQIKLFKWRVDIGTLLASEGYVRLCKNYT